MPDLKRTGLTGVWPVAVDDAHLPVWKRIASRGSPWLPVAGFVALLAVPLLYATHAIDIVTVNNLGRFLCVAIVALGIDLVWGYTGILTLCQAMFFCIGGYAIGMHMALHGPLDGDGIPRCLYVVSSEVSGLKLPWFWKPFQTLPVSVFLALFLPGLFAALFGFFTFRSRVRGVYFSIITQATTVAALNIFRKNEMRLCGTNGLTNFVTLAGLDLQAPRVKIGLYLLTVIVLAAVYLLCIGIVRSRLGRLLRATRDNESRLRFAGHTPVSIQVFIFTLGAVIAAIGGMLYTPQNGIITPYKMEAIESISLVILVAVGGRATLSGAVLGALLISYLNSYLTSGTFYGWLPEILKVPTDPAFHENALMHLLRTFFAVFLKSEGWPFVLGGIFVAVTLLLPDGIVGAWRKWIRGDARGFRAGLAADAASSSRESGRETPAPATPAVTSPPGGAI